MRLRRVKPRAARPIPKSARVPGSGTDTTEAVAITSAVFLLAAVVGLELPEGVVIVSSPDRQPVAEEKKLQLKRLYPLKFKFELKRIPPPVAVPKKSKVRSESVAESRESPKKDMVLLVLLSVSLEVGVVSRILHATMSATPRSPVLPLVVIVPIAELDEIARLRS